MNNLMRSSNGSGNVFVLGLRNGNPVCSNSLRVLLEYPSMDSRTCKVQMDLDGLPSKSLAILRSCQRVIHASTELIYHHIRIMRVSNIN